MAGHWPGNAVRSLVMHADPVAVYAHTFLGGALGSALGAVGWTRWGWNGVCAAGALQLVVALGVRAWSHSGGSGLEAAKETVSLA